MLKRIVLATWFALPNLTSAQPIQLFSGLASPISYVNPINNQAQGMAVDMVKEIIACSGDQTTISAHPWSRAVKLWENTPYSGLFVADRTAERETRYQWVGPIFKSTFSFYSLKSADFEVPDLAVLKTMGTIAVPRGWQAVTRAKKEGLTNLLEVSDTSQLWPMLQSERVAIIGVDDLMLNSMTAETEHVKRLFSYATINGYLALTRDIPSTQVKRWQNCFDRMHQNGTYQRIYLHWVGVMPEQTQ